MEPWWKVKHSSLFLAALNQSFVSGYIDHQQSQKAIDLFKGIRNPNAVILILFFNACAQIQTSEALDCVKQASSKIPPSFYLNSNLSPSLLDALIKCGDFSSAQAVFTKMKRCVIDYGSLMSGFNKANRPEETLELFDRMKKDSITPNGVIFLCVIKAVAQTGMCSLSGALVHQIPRSIFNDPIRTALIDMWVSSSSLCILVFLKRIRAIGENGFCGPSKRSFRRDWSPKPISLRRNEYVLIIPFVMTFNSSFDQFTAMGSTEWLLPRSMFFVKCHWNWSTKLPTSVFSMPAHMPDLLITLV